MRHVTRAGSLAIALVLGVLVGAADVATAQSDPINWQKGTALGVFGGAAATTGGTDGASGMVFAWEITPRFTMEGSATWLGGDIDAFNWLIGPRIHLAARRPVVPFVSGAVGVQHATVDHASQMPSFYRRRMDPTHQAAGFPVQQTFNDLVLAAGTGLDLYLQRHVALRPEVRLMFVSDDSGSRAVTVFGLVLAYHFEEHQITP